MSRSLATESSVAEKLEVGLIFGISSAALWFAAGGAHHIHVTISAFGAHVDFDLSVNTDGETGIAPVADLMEFGEGDLALLLDGCMDNSNPHRPMVMPILA